jgi:hypothetical protein
MIQRKGYSKPETWLTKFTAGRERCRAGLRLAYRVAQVCHADARDHRRVAKDGWRAGEVVEESNSGAKENRRDVDANFVEEAHTVLTVYRQ